MHLSNKLPLFRLVIIILSTCYGDGGDKILLIEKENAVLIGLLAPNVVLIKELLTLKHAKLVKPERFTQLRFVEIIVKLLGSLVQ